MREQYPPIEEDTISCIIVFRMSHARSLSLIPAPNASLRLSYKWNGINSYPALRLTTVGVFLPTSLLLIFDNRFIYPLGLLALTIQIGLCRPSLFAFGVRSFAKFGLSILIKDFCLSSLTTYIYIPNIHLLNFFSSKNCSFR